MINLKKKFSLSKLNEFVLIFFICVVGFIARIPALDKSLNEYFSFRQTQTAWGAKALLLFNSNEFITQTPVLGNPFKIPFEFPLYQWMHYLIIKITNQEVDFSGRLLSLVIFQLTAINLYVFARFIINKEVAIFSLILFQFTPFGFQWSTAVLIDYLSIFLILAGLNFFILLRRFPLQLGFSLFFISLASLIKITTLIISIPVILFVIYFRVKRFGYYLLTNICLIFIPFIVGSLWTAYADFIKRQTNETAWLTSKNLFTWNFGTISDRFNPNVWIKILNIMDLISLGFKGSFLLLFAILIILIYIDKLKSSNLNFIFILIISTILGPFILINLYYVHDYYFIPNSTFLVIVISYLIYYFIMLLLKTNRVVLNLFLVGLTIFSTWLSPTGVNYYNNLKTKPTIPERSISIKKHTTQNELILLINCNNWDPTILYYADRRGLLIWEGVELKRDVMEFNAIMKCDDTSWDDIDKIDLNKWKVVQDDLIIRKNLND